MSRGYDSSFRQEQAQLTVRRILDAAVELHRQGITAFEPLARAAGVSAATVRKHFPNKEMLFQGCTGHFFESFEAPALETAARLTDARDRVARVTAEMCRTHEETHDLVWHSYAQAPHSPTIAAVLDKFAGLVQAAADAVVDGRGLTLRPKARNAARLRVSALLHPLTYRAFRVHSGLDFETTQRELTALVETAVGISILD